MNVKYLYAKEKPVRFSVTHRSEERFLGAIPGVTGETPSGGVAHGLYRPYETLNLVAISHL